MELNLQQIKTYSTCSRRYKFLQENPPTILKTKNDIILKIIQKTYQKQETLNYLIPWKKIVEWANKEILTTVDITIPNIYDKVKKISESIIIPLNHWYFEFFKKEQCFGYINVPVSHSLKGVKISDTVPVIKSTSTPTILLLSEYPYTELNIQNDIISRGFLYLVSKNLDYDRVNLENYFIGSEGKFYKSSIKGNKKYTKSMENVLSNVVQSMSLKISYPAFSEECKSCQFREMCVL